ncbi:MAG: hypothetical protein O7F71_05890 [Gammaproteobacteria bacterium]|nr:hypothetical protein [Gammaproteobacteria bacterium]
MNGRDDRVFPLETNQIPLFHLLGTADNDNQHTLFDGGHYDIPRTAVIRAAADWLDQYLGVP